MATLPACSGCHESSGAKTDDGGAATVPTASATDGGGGTITVADAAKIAPSDAKATGGSPITLTKTAETKVDRARSERVDPAPRARLQRAQLGELRRQYERARHSGTGDALARVWRAYLTKEVPPASHPMIEALFGPDGSDVIGAYEARYGAAMWAESFRLPGRDALVVVHDAPSPAPKVGRFDEHQHYTVVTFTLRGDGGAAPAADGAVDLDALYPGVLEMQDARVGDDGALYVNVVHPGAPSEVGGKTGYLASIDVAAGKLRFETGPGTSRGEIGVDGDLVFTTFGAKPDANELIVSDAKTGARVGSAPIPGTSVGVRIVDHKVHVGTSAVDLEFEAHR